MNNKEILIKTLNDFKEFFDTECEYWIGYLDAIQNICESFNIEHTRYEDDLTIH